MIRISLSFIFELASKLDPLLRLPEQDTKFSDVNIPLYVAESAILEVHSQALYAPYLRNCYSAGDQLLKSIKEETQNNDMNREIRAWSLWKIKSNCRSYRTLLVAELAILHSYFVTQKGGFDTTSLLFWGENLFPDDITRKVPEALFDMREAGKCLAYEVATSAAFHVFRATESVLRRYYSHVTDGSAAPKVRSIKVYVDALRRHGGADEKVLFALTQLADLYRNPLVHPEAALTADEAISVFGVARSAIAQMLAVLPILPPTTTSPQPIPTVPTTG